LHFIENVKPHSALELRNKMSSGWARAQKALPDDMGLAVRRDLAESVNANTGRCLVEKTKGTPQGGVVSPLFAALFLHYAFDSWIGLPPAP